MTNSGKIKSPDFDTAYKKITKNKELGAKKGDILKKCRAKIGLFLT